MPDRAPIVYLPSRDTILHPEPRRGLAAPPARRQIRDDLLPCLDGWMEGTDDPWRHGDVPMPPRERRRPRLGSLSRGCH